MANFRSANWLQLVTVALILAIGWAGYLLNVPIAVVAIATLIALVLGVYWTRRPDTSSHPHDPSQRSDQESR